MRMFSYSVDFIKMDLHELGRINANLNQDSLG